MNKNLKKLLALALAALLPLGMIGTTAAEGVGTPSDLPSTVCEAPAQSEEPSVMPEPTEAPVVSEEPTTVPEPTEAPVATEAPTAAPEATEVPTAAPEATEVPTAAPEVTEVPAETEEAGVTPEPTAAPVEPEMQDVTVTIVWKDNSNALGVRPETVKVTVNGSDGSSYSAQAKDRPLEGEDENHAPHDQWEETFSSLPKTAGEAEIAYSLWAKAPEGYTIEISGMTVRMILKETETPAPETTETPAEETEAPAEATEIPAEATEAPAAEDQTLVEDIPDVTEPPALTYEPDPTEEPAEAEPSVNVSVNADTDIRLEGDGLSEIILTIPADTPVVVLGVEGDWAKVEVDGVTGYIYKDSVNEWEQIKPEETQDGDAAEKETNECPIKVTIFSSRRSVMLPGEEVILTSKMEGSEGYETLLQWQCDKGSGFEDVPGANEDHYSFAASVETLSYSWRLVVYYR